MTKSTAFNISLLTGLILAIVFSNFFSFVNEYQALETGVLRMHILANSDSEADQSLKIKVRDRILENSDIIFGDCSSKETAKASVRLDKIKEIAEQVIFENNYSYDVKCYLVNMQYVAGLVDSDFIMINDKMIPIRKSGRKLIVKKYEEFFKESLKQT